MGRDSLIDLRDRRGQQRLRAFPSHRSFNGGGHIIENVAILLSERACDRQHPFDKPAASLAVSAETYLAPNHAAPDHSFARIVGWADPFHPDKRPHGRRKF